MMVGAGKKLVRLNIDMIMTLQIWHCIMEKQLWLEPMQRRTWANLTIRVFGEVMHPISKSLITELKNGPTWSEIRFFPKERPSIGGGTSVTKDDSFLIFGGILEVYQGKNLTKIHQKVNSFLFLPLLY